MWNIIKVIIMVSACLASAALCEPQKSQELGENAIIKGGALDGHRYRIAVSTDIGGTDPDDFPNTYSTIFTPPYEYSMDPVDEVKEIVTAR